MADSLRYSCWLIHNISLSESFKKTFDFDGQKIEVLVANYNGLGKLNNDLKGWVDGIVSHTISSGVHINPLGNVAFVITISGHENASSYEFSYRFRDALRFTFLPPVSVSHTAEYIPKKIATFPSWETTREVILSSHQEINPNTFEKVSKYFEIFKSRKKGQFHILQEIYQMANINNTPIELLSLWAFIEGFWHNSIGESKVKESFLRMLKDYVPGKERKFERQEISKKIESQNNRLGQEKFNGIRVLLAHGMYHTDEDFWKSEQQKTLREQRELLFPIVIDSLINHTLEQL